MGRSGEEVASHCLLVLARRPMMGREKKAMGQQDRCTGRRRREFQPAGDRIAGSTRGR